MNTLNIKHFPAHWLAAVLFAALLPLFVSCDNDVHGNEYPLDKGKGALVVGLQAHDGAAVNALALYLFGSDGETVLQKTYDDPRALASDYIPVAAGTYTLVVLANADAAALPQQTTPSDLAMWLDENSAANPALLTASEQVEVGEGNLRRLLLQLQDGTSGIRLSTVRLALTVPGSDMPAYKAARATTAGKSLRCVAEVYRAGTTSCIHRRTQLCPQQPDGRYLAELLLLPGEYDLRLWVDLADGSTAANKYYDASDLGKVVVLTDNYVANGQTAEKDAFYGVSALSVGDGTQDNAVTLERPFAKYRLIATDVEAYYNLIDKGENLPAIEDLRVRVTYEGFFPTGFNVVTGKPNDALNTGIHYTSVPTVAEGYDTAVNRQVGADFVLTNGEESFVNVTIQMIDTNTGDIIATVQHVKIPYKRGHLTTVTGHFLTAGKTPGGVQIDTEWGDDIVVEF